MISEHSKKILDWLAQSKEGDNPPEGILRPNTWAAELREVAKEVLKELDERR